MRDEVCELLHDGCPVACLGDAPFCLHQFIHFPPKSGVLQGAALPDPDRMSRHRQIHAP